jgi:hypothetical protein
VDRTGQDRGHHAGCFHLFEHQRAAMINADAIDVANASVGPLTHIDFVVVFSRSCHPRD